VVPRHPSSTGCAALASAWRGGCSRRGFSGANWGQEGWEGAGQRRSPPQPAAPLTSEPPPAPAHLGAATGPRSPRSRHRPPLTSEPPSAPAHLEASGGPCGRGVARPHQVPAAQPLAQRPLQQVLEADGVHGGVLGQDEALDGDDGGALLPALGPHRLDHHVQRGGMRRPPAPGQQTGDPARASGCWERCEDPLVPAPRHTDPHGLWSPQSRAATALLIPAASQRQGPWLRPPEQSPSPTEPQLCGARQTPYPAEAPWQLPPKQQPQPCSRAHLTPSQFI